MALCDSFSHRGPARGTPSVRSQDLYMCLYCHLTRAFSAPANKLCFSNAVRKASPFSPGDQASAQASDDADSNHVAANILRRLPVAARSRCTTSFATDCRGCTCIACVSAPTEEPTLTLVANFRPPDSEHWCARLSSRNLVQRLPCAAKRVRRAAWPPCVLYPYGATSGALLPQRHSQICQRWFGSSCGTVIAPAWLCHACHV